MIVLISPPHPPAITETIQNITAYQGQEMVVLKISKGFFYSKNEEFSIVFKFCIDVNPNKNNSEMSFKNFNSLTFLQIIFNKKFVGI